MDLTAARPAEHHPNRVKEKSASVNALFTSPG
jgi:hypothetical protein